MNLKLNRPLNDDEVIFLNTVFSKLPTHYYSYLYEIRSESNKKSEFLFDILKELKQHDDLEDFQSPIIKNTTDFKKALSTISEILPNASIGTHMAFLFLSLDTKATPSGNTIEFTHESIVFPESETHNSKNIDNFIFAISSQLSLLNFISVNSKLFSKNENIFKENNPIFTQQVSIDIENNDSKNINHTVTFKYLPNDDAIEVEHLTYGPHKYALNEQAPHDIVNFSSYKTSLTNQDFYEQNFNSIESLENPINPQTLNLIKKIAIFDLVEYKLNNQNANFQNIQKLPKI